MTTDAVRQHGNPNRAAYATVRIPSRKVEYTFYLAIFYSLTNEIWGISVPLLAGVLMLGVAWFCVRELRSAATAVYAPIKLLIASGISLLLIQVLIHGESITSATLRAFIIWILQLLIVFSLCLRKGFSFRYPILLFALALSTLPFLSFDTGGDVVDRARVSVDLGIQGGLSHPGGIAEWFGFFAVYFAICGLEDRRFTRRIGAWLLAVGCLSISALAVSRAVLIASALALTIAFRAFLKRGFVPILVLLIVTWVIFETGFFDQAISHYTERGMEETGRELLWPDAMKRILASPLVGVGVANVGSDVLRAGFETPPHNSFLYFALSSGVLPFAFYIAFWIQVGWRSILAKGRERDPFRLPYLVFTFVTVMSGDSAFMTVWGILALSVVAGSPPLYKKPPLLTTGLRNKLALRFPVTSGFRRQVPLARKH